MGNHPEHLVALAGGNGHRAVVIANAVDEAPPDARRALRDGQALLVNGPDTAIV
jgi:hypothetical protein